MSDRIGIRRSFESPWLMDSALVIALFVGALAIRLPKLTLIPAFTDESSEVLECLRITRAHHLPLSNRDPYNGALYNYIIAGVFTLFGTSARNARLTIAVMNALSVPLSYLFAKGMTNRLTGLVVGALMLTSGALIFSSHIAWGNEMAPFFSTATLLAFALALRKPSGPLLVLSGFLFGLTLQTHPGMLVFGVGLGAAFLCAGLTRCEPFAGRSLKSWLLTAWPYLTALAVCLGYANMLAQHFVEPSRALATAERRGSYAYESDRSIGALSANVWHLGLLALRMASSDLEDQPWEVDHLWQPPGCIYLAVLIFGIGFAIRRRNLLPVTILGTTGLMLPLYCKEYGYPEKARYVAYLFPLLYLLIAAPLVDALRSGRFAAGFRRVIPWTLIGALVLWPALSLVLYYSRAEQQGETNAALFTLRDAVEHQYRSDSVQEILLDNRLGKIHQESGGSTKKSLDFLLELDAVPHRFITLTPDTIKAEIDAAPSRRLLVAIAADSYYRLSGAFRMRPIYGLDDPNLTRKAAKSTFGACFIDPPQR